MNQIISLLTRIAANPHTSIAGFVWAVCKLGAIWLPAHKAQFDATEAVAVGYGLFMAGDSKPRNGQPSPPESPKPQEPPKP